jgi:uncharacterized damage-inducible protein DinB
MSTMTADEIRFASRTRSAADYPGTIRSYYPFWDTRYRPFLIKAIEAIPADRFDFKPRPELLTAHQIIVHIPEAERAWIHQIVEGGTDEEWVIPHPEPGQGWKTVRDVPDHAALLALLEEWHRPTQRWLDRPVAELERVIEYKFKDGTERRYKLHYILDHLQEHEIHHRAQLNLYLRLMGIEPPSI